MRDETIPSEANRTDLQYGKPSQGERTRRDVLQAAFPQHMHLIEQNLEAQDRPQWLDKDAGIKTAVFWLTSAFLWDDTPEGHEFWRRVCDASLPSEQSE